MVNVISHVNIMAITILKRIMLLFSVIFLDNNGPINEPGMDPIIMIKGRYHNTPCDEKSEYWPEPKPTVIFAAAANILRKIALIAASLSVIPKPITNKGINRTPPDIPIDPEASPITPPNKGSDQIGSLTLNLSLKLIRIITTTTNVAKAMWKYILNSSFPKIGPIYNSDKTVIGITPKAISIVFFQSGLLFCLIYLYKAKDARARIETYAINFASKELSVPINSIIIGIDTTPPPNPISDASIDERSPISIIKGIVTSGDKLCIHLLLIII